MAVKGKGKGRNYYASLAKSKAERLELRRAASVAGLADEIALLRTQVKKAVQASPRTAKARKDLRAVTQGVETLLRAVTAEYRLPRRSGRELKENIEGILNSFGDLILPADR